MNLIAAWQTQDSARDWWLGSAMIVVVERIATFGYFIPTAVRLMRTDAVPARAAATALRWITFNYVRATLTLLGWLAALEPRCLVG